MSPPDPHTANTSPWHSGERRLQALTGDAARMEEIGQRFVRDQMPDQHRAFFAQLPFVVLGVVDEQGQPWATVLEGEVGFMHSPDPRRLQIGVGVSKDDPAHSGFRPDAPLGLLGIEPLTRRRNRMNGRIGASDVHGFDIEVRESFGNCPQYIQARALVATASPEMRPVSPAEHFIGLDDAAQEAIAAADTFFVASSFNGDAEYAEARVDVSHRGGKPGFVRLQGQTLLIPDFAGNRFFNTLGNLLLNPKAGLLFVDHESGTLLQMAGSVEIVLQGPELHGFEGAERLWRFTVNQVVRRRGAMAMRSRLVDYSPSLAFTGGWPAPSQRVAPGQIEGWRALRVGRVVQESDTVRSFYLQPQDGLPLADFLPGQHLPVQWRIKRAGQPSGQSGGLAFRNYSLSQGPANAGYRLSIQRDGQVSGDMHDHLQAGDTLQVGLPQGQFVLDAGSQRPVLLLAGGIGITPLLSMLQHLLADGERTGVARATTLVYATRNVAERGFDAELAALVERAPQALRVVRVVSRPESTARIGVDHEAKGRVHAALLQTLLGTDEHDIFVCGPPSFAQSMYDSLRALNVPDHRIHAESFGPAALQRSAGAGVGSPVAAALDAPSSKPVTVGFASAHPQAVWTPQRGSLLALAESAGLNPVYGCRGGHCGSCRTRVLEGRVTYLQPPIFQTEPDEALICCAVPAEHQPGEALHLVLDL